MEIGSAIHCAILEPERYASDYKIVECDARTSAMYKAACKDRSKDMVLTSAEGDGVSGMSAAIYSDPDALEILNAPGRNELSVFAKDPETGLIVKCRFDRLNNDLMAADIKKTQDAREDAFSRTVNTYLYHMQAAFYSDVFEWATGEQLRGFDFIAVEERPPHACKVYGLDEEALMIGRAMYREALTVYAKCVDSGKWPAYSGGRKVIGLPGYAISQFEDELEVTFDE
jgi:exodeoxyribonuclease VIII